MWEILKPLILRAIGILLTAAILPVLQKAQALGLFGDSEIAQIVATLTAVLLAVAWFVYQRIVSLGVQKVAQIVPAAATQGELTLANARTVETVKAQNFGTKLEILRTGLDVGSAVTHGRGKTGKAFEIAQLVAERLGKR